jgi:hypothetical protein
MENFIWQEKCLGISRKRTILWLLGTSTCIITASKLLVLIRPDLIWLGTILGNGLRLIDNNYCLVRYYHCFNTHSFYNLNSRQKQNEVLSLESEIREKTELQRKAGVELESTCQICLKTKFADGIGHLCNYCSVRCCARCGGKVALRSNKVRRKTEPDRCTGLIISKQPKPNEPNRTPEKDFTELTT